MQARLLLAGFVAWALGTVILRLAGQHVLPSEPARVAVLCLVTIPIAAGLVFAVCQGMKVPPADSLASAAIVVLPTLILDPFTTAYFGVVFPAVAASAAAPFAAWMLSWAAGGLAGGWLRQATQ